MDPKEEARLKVNAYLARQKGRLRVLGIDMAMFEVRIWVPEASRLSDSELRSVVLGYYLVNGFALPLVTPPPTGPDLKIVKAVKSAVTTVIDGVDIQRGAGKINISISGLTASLQKGDASASMGVSWSGTMSMNASKGNFYLSGELSKDRWELKLSYPQDTAVPDLNKLGKVFGEGEKAMRGIITATRGISDLKDIPKAADAMKPYMQPVKDAVEAAQGIAKASRGVSVGFSLGSPDPLLDQGGMPKGIQGSITLTWVF